MYMLTLTLNIIMDFEQIRKNGLNSSNPFVKFIFKVFDIGYKQ